MSFIIYDLILFVLFTLFVVIFLYRKKHNLKREGLLYLYRTKLGIEFIEWTTKKYGNFLRKIQYLVITCGYVLMFFGLWMILRVAYTYVTSPYIAKALKVPVIMPLVPYLPELFKIDFLPPFYFTYWIIIIAVIAVPHEFAHGIFARLNKIKILSTGFGFLGPFLAAFVEQDDKHMRKASKFAQLSVLAAGTFANVLATIFFALLLLAFFSSAFVPAGVNFSTYAISVVNVSSISSIGPNYLDNSSLIEVKANNQTYFADELILNDSINNKEIFIMVYDNSPAINAKLSGAISEINGYPIRQYQEINATLSKYKPGDNVSIKTISKDGVENDYNITLGNKNGRAFLGIGILPQERSGFFGWVYNLLGKIKDPYVYYQSTLGEFGDFIFNLLWWLVMINLSVALMNMLPLGIFDGGRFFYLTIWGLTGKEKYGKLAYKISTWILLAIIAIMLVKWVLIFF